MDREQLARECLKIEKAGCSVREYLRRPDCISPWGTWYRLQREELGRKLWQIQDGKGEEVMGKITLEQKKKAVEIALAGNDPCPYLKECGSEKPWVTWANIKRNLEYAEPETFRKLITQTEAMPVTEGTAEPKIQLTIPAEELTETDSPRKIRKEDIALRKEDIRITMPTNFAGFDITGLRTGYGEFHVSCNGYLFFGANDHDELEMPVDVWRKFAADLPKIMEILGIGE